MKRGEMGGEKGRVWEREQREGVGYFVCVDSRPILPHTHSIVQFLPSPSGRAGCLLPAVCAAPAGDRAPGSAHTLHSTDLAEAGEEPGVGAWQIHRVDLAGSG